MKKWLLGLLLLPMMAMANEPKVKEVFREYVIQDNNLNKCLFPEIYQSSDRGSEALERWWQDAENGGRQKRAYYLKLKIRLAQKIMPSEMAEQFLFKGAYDAEYKQALKHYPKKVTIKSNKECGNVSQYAIHLIEEYDEFNDKWRKEFPNP